MMIEISPHEPLRELADALQDACRAWGSATANFWCGRDELARFDLMQVVDALDQARKHAESELRYEDDDPEDAF